MNAVLVQEVHLLLQEVLPAQDLALWVGALSATPSAASEPPPEMRMTAEQTREVIAAIAAALAEDNLTIDELNDAVADLAESHS